MLKDIITLPNKTLRDKSKTVDIIDDSIMNIIDRMKNASLDWENSRKYEISAAMSAVQIGELKRIIVLRDDFDDKDNKNFTTLINPEIIKYQGEILYDYEGCLSVSDSIYGKVPRYSKIRIKAQDIDGNTLNLKADGFLARVLQHEIDHTNGVVFIDRIKDQKNAFFQLNKKGDLDPIDYDKYIKDNHILWD